MIRWGIIGCGAVTEQKSGPAFQRVPRSSLVAVMRRNGDLARDYAGRHGVPRWYDDADALIADGEVDAVYVATPPSSHAELALRCARAKKPCYVEKPMAVSPAEVDQMCRAFDDVGVPLFVAYYRRALPRFLAVRDALADIGDVRTVHVALGRAVRPEERSRATLSWRVRPEISGGGHFVDLACHTLDLLDFLLGPIASVTGFATNQAGLYDAEDVVAASFRFRSGVLGSGIFSFASRPFDEVTITGTQGRLSFATFADVPVTVDTDAGTRSIAIAHPTHIQEPLIATIVHALHGDGVCPSTGASAARTTRVTSQLLGAQNGDAAR